jgi:hypothetical protein
MTAPLAWLYAIPHERYLSREWAIDANLYTLTIVAIWRVLLMIRIVSVCSELPLRAVVGVVLSFSTILAGIAWIIYVVANISVIGLMGGLRGLDEPGYRGPAWLLAAFGGFPCAFFPLLCIIVWLTAHKGTEVSWLPRHEQDAAGPSLWLVAVSVLSLLVWVPVLVLTQPEQQRRTAFEDAVRAEDYEEAAALLDQPRDAFPPHWLPPMVSTPGFATIHPDPGQIAGMLEALHAQGGPDWAIAVYAGRLHRLLGRGITAPQKERLVVFLPRCPEGVAMLAEARGWSDEVFKELEKQGEYEESRRRGNILGILAALNRRRKEQGAGAVNQLP